MSGKSRSNKEEMKKKAAPRFRGDPGVAGPSPLSHSLDVRGGHGRTGAHYVGPGALTGSRAPTPRSQMEPLGANLPQTFERVERHRAILRREKKIEEIRGKKGISHLVRGKK